ncbi:hypothetical protein [Vacuolonema iberomarrocanum]|uniref:hypothetical protein n=1 Tax=Vacuolonema iberomarrocanum TaxID=3454632 RepID=UPI001A0C2FA9|nr:hypothetical protein [filamentous cyanobacterium LEGE 07170]
MKGSFKWISLGLLATALLAFPLKASAQQMPDYNYVGVGGSDNGFVINGKFIVHDNISVRPSVATDFEFDDEEDVSYLLLATYDLNAVDQEGRLYPFAGAGIGGDIGDDSTVEFALAGGVDYRISDRWFANGSINYLPFADEDEVSLILGIAHTF